MPHLLATVFPIFFKNVRLSYERIMCHVFYYYHKKIRTYISYYNWFDFSNMFSSISFFEIMDNLPILLPIIYIANNIFPPLYNYVIPTNTEIIWSKIVHIID